MSRRMTVDERIWARHLLQVLSEHAKTVRRCMDPQEGLPHITDEAWVAQWNDLKQALEVFTADVVQGRPPTMNTTLGGRPG